MILMLTFCSRSILRSQKLEYQYIDIEKNEREKSEKQSSFPDSTSLGARLTRAFAIGVGYENEQKTLWIGSAGLWSTVPVYNFVDGFWLGQTFQIEYKPDQENNYKLIPMIYYGTASKKITWETRFIYAYSRRMQGKFYISGGDLSSDYDTEEHLGRLENSIYSLVWGRNYMKLFRKRYVSIKNRFYPFSGLRVSAGTSYQWRESLDNNTTFSFISDFYNPANIPVNKKFRAMKPNQALISEVGCDVTLSIYNQSSTNEIIYSYIPTISFLYSFGIPVGRNSSQFKRIDLNVSQRFKFSHQTTMEYKIGGGKFLSKKNLQFPDFKHFGAYGLPSMRTFTDDGFFLIGYYLADTDDKWIKATANFMSEHFLFSSIYPFNNNDFNEGFHLRYLWTPEAKHYEEIGYSVGYKDIVRIGAFMSFNLLTYKNIGITVSFPWLTGGY